MTVHVLKEAVCLHCGERLLRPFSSGGEAYEYPLCKPCMKAHWANCPLMSQALFDSAGEVHHYLLLSGRASG